MVKRILDIILAIFLLLLFLPLGILIAFLLILEGSGEIFYKSKRAGKNGTIFYMFKFSTMYNDGDKRLTSTQRSQLEQDFKLENDPRITPIGHFLRRSSLDELPQVFNVLRGEMSIVGPRPKLPEELHLYGNRVEDLLSVQPGLTGYWQVFRKSAASDIVMRKMDLFYIQNKSLLMDIFILLRTPLVILWGRNG